MINPEFFNWGQRIQEGMQQSQDNRRKNALLDLEQRQHGLQERQIGMQEGKFAHEKEAAERSRRGRVAGLQYFGFPKEMAEQLADDQDFPELFMEITGKGGSEAPAAQRLAQWLANEATEAERAALQYTLRANSGKLADVAGVPTVVDTNLNRMPDFDSLRQPQGFPAGGGNVPTMAPYQPVAPGIPPRPQVRSGGARPLSSLEAEATAAQRIKEAEGFGSVTGQETAKRQEAINTKIQNISNMDELLDLAGPLVQASTGSLVGSGVDKLTNAFGFSLSGDQAIGALQPIAAALLANVPRMEGPQSDADRIQYERAAGDVANPTLPREKRLAAIRQIRTINAKYRALNTDTRKGQKRIVRTGTLKGRKVVEYSDGTVEYADKSR